MKFTTDYVQSTGGIALAVKRFQKLTSIFLILNPEQSLFILRSSE